MKKRLAFALVLAAITFSALAYSAFAAGRKTETAKETYTLTEYEGGLAVYKNGTLYETLPDAELSVLPDCDRKALKNGIECETYEQILVLLEDIDG